MESAPVPPPERVKQTKVVLFAHELLGVTDDIEYTVALPEARSVTTMLASVSGATAWGRTDDGLATLEPWWGPNPPVRGASAAAGRLKATVPVSVATAMAMPETTPLRARRSHDLDNLIRTSPLSPRALSRGDLLPGAAGLSGSASANTASSFVGELPASARFRSPMPHILCFP